MANTIVDFGGGELICRMNNARFARPAIDAVFPVGGAWSKIRVGIRCAITDSGGSLSGTPRFGIGVCSGSSNILGDATPAHWVGAITNDSSVSRAAGPPVNYAFNPLVPAKNVAGTLTTGSSFGAFFVNVGEFGMWFIDITKGSPNFSVQCFVRSNSTGGSFSQTDFFNTVTVESATLTSHAFTSTQTIAVDETADGDLDHGNLWWNQTVSSWDVSDLAIVRFA